MEEKEKDRREVGKKGKGREGIEHCLQQADVSTVACELLCS